jgi:selenocysteine-specific elongation factor
VTDAPLTLGTAGHIDHGKTALVGALTGRQTDRLPEERARGISIELGYARLELPGGRRLSVVDVPGHERFVRTMVAGASGIDLYLLCVACDDGVMPQTREHVAILRRLGVEHGVVAITKADVGEPELAAEEVEELLPGVPKVAVSATERTGLEELLAALDAVAASLPGRAGGGGPARLHVDRSFTLKGIGTVVTGTLWEGAVGSGERVTVLPTGLEARVRSVHVHDEPVERAVAGQRVALNLVGPRWHEIARGDVVVGGSAAPPRPAYMLDVAVELEEGARPLERGARLHVHHGTREVPARIYPLGPAGGAEGPGADAVEPGARAYAQLRLEAPLVAARGDRFILRQVAPPDTVGGGVVVDPAARRHGPGREIAERLAALERGERPAEPVAEEEPAAPGDPEPEPLGEAALRLAALLREDGAAPRADGELAAAAGIGPGEAATRFAELERAGRAVRVAKNLHYDPEALEGLLARVVAICEREGSATIAGVRDELGTSRRYAQALLEHMDAEKLTIRRGDEHVLRRRRAAGA